MPVSDKCVSKGYENIFSGKKAIDNDAGIEEEESEDVPIGEKPMAILRNVRLV